MKELLKNIAAATPTILENCHFSVELKGTPAAVAVCFACGTVAVIYITYNVERFQELKLTQGGNDQRTEPGMGSEEEQITGESTGGSF